MSNPPRHGEYRQEESREGAEAAQQQEHAEELLKKSEALLREAERIAQIGCWELDLLSNQLTWSDEIYRLFGIDPEAFGASYEAFLEAIHPEDRERVNRAYVKSLQTRTPYDLVHRLLMPDGRTKYVHERCETTYAADGTPLRSTGTVQDVTAQVLGEEALRESREMLAGILNSVPQAIFWKDSNSVYLGCNENFARSAGLATAEEILGKTDYDLSWSREEADKYRADDQEVIRKNEPKRHIIEPLHLPSGELLWIDTTKVPLLDRAGSPCGVLGVYDDITEQRRAEEERQKHQSQLAQAQKLESVGRLAGGVAHDFNNMLSVILGHVELAMENLDPAHPAHADLEEIRMAAQRSAALTGQLLAYARRQIIVPRVLDLNQTVEGMLKMLRRLIGEDIELTWSPGRQLRPVEIDPSQVDQILANLCVNACQAIRGGGRITIETHNAVLDETYCANHPGSVPGPYVMLAVSDNGCGMEKELAEHIFEPFFSSKGIGEGTGLGLATIHGIVKQNSGHINVYSEPGHGSTFKIYLPGRVDIRVVPQQERARELRTGGNQTILFVEDEPAILRMGQVMLRQLGYTVVAAATPLEAIRQAHQLKNGIDLLMTDVVMPEMNGRALADRLESLHPDLKCLFMSGYTANVIAHHGVLDEGVNFLQKPFSFQELADKVHEVLASSIMSPED